MLGELGEIAQAELTPYITVMNVYLMYENVSDNLAIGLACPDPSDTSSSVRKQVVHDFNESMMARLAEPIPSAAKRIDLRGLAPLADGISLFRQSLAEDEHRLLSRAYLREREPKGGVRVLEQDVIAPLQANIESAAEVARTVLPLPCGELVRAGLIARYAAVNRLLSDDERDLEENLRLGTDSILVYPTLAYYLAVVGDALGLAPGFSRRSGDLPLQEGLRAAALIVRLLNDVGSLLLEIDDEPLAEVLRSVTESSRQERSARVALIAEASQRGNLFTRIAKDIEFGEFNVCLDGVLSSGDPVAAVERFCERLHDVRRSYRGAVKTLKAASATINACTAGQAPLGDLLSRFVGFHQRMYAESHRSTAGEYAVAQARGQAAG
ncbi:hypothetical protein AB0M48_38590 [Lentzea sp. NPDC051208]|uniref:hypothetical protein n=1 Tax=Lentzea sp. NPDC051208 TaxID=3154642 RepID=UPI0034335DB5